MLWILLLILPRCDAERWGGGPVGRNLGGETRCANLPRQLLGRKLNGSPLALPPRCKSPNEAGRSGVFFWGDKKHKKFGKILSWKDLEHVLSFHICHIFEKMMPLRIICFGWIGPLDRQAGRDFCMLVAHFMRFVVFGRKMFLMGSSFETNQTVASMVDIVFYVMKYFRNKHK